MNISKAKILSLLDLTSLNDDDTPAVIDALCRNATQAIGKVAAVCVCIRRLWRKAAQDCPRAAASMWRLWSISPRAMSRWQTC